LISPTILTELGAGQPGISSQYEHRSDPFSSPPRPHRPCDPPCLPSNAYLGPFPRE